MHTHLESVPELIDINGQQFYLITDVDQMAPFLIAVVSSSDHWMYISSSGGLSAGRVNAQHSLFPYRTDDLLHEIHGFSGPWTGIRVGETLWEPLHGRSTPGCSRNLARSTAGDQMCIEEHHHELGLTLQSVWGFSERSGFVRTMTLTHSAEHTEPITAELADGLRDLVAGGAPLSAMSSMSCLINAYTRTDLIGSRLATITMESALSDVAEPAESLYANVVWSTGLPNAAVSVGEDICTAFIRGDACTPTHSSRGQRGAYLLYDSITLEPGESITWSIVSDVHQSQTEVVAIAERLKHGNIAQAELDQEILSITKDMDQLISSTDGFQCTAQPVQDAHHRMNTLFNDMRGGIFVNHDQIPWGDWVNFLQDRNRPCAKANQSWLESHPEESWIDRTSLMEEITKRNDPTLLRIGLEYLPLWFGRRHGDPSRPWNTFNIRIKNSDGSRRLTYEGNWRDIFQNWEALLLSEPEWIDNVIAKFVNATTLDGFNPYRITREGIDWETPDPGNPWSNLGYWGDHQISYLTRLLELSDHSNPSSLTKWMDAPLFSYADVPYTLRTHQEIVADPRRTISFDTTSHKKSLQRAQQIGSDGLLVHHKEEIVLGTLAEKLLVPILAKLSSLVPDGGIWMNTQRPEWNDANNALAGYGLSMVTACYLRRHLAVVSKLMHRTPGNTTLRTSVAEWMNSISNAFTKHNTLLERPTIDDQDRREVIDQLGLAFEHYRNCQHEQFVSSSVALSECVEFCKLAIRWLDHCISANKRSDGLHHGYNLISFQTHTAHIHSLPEMLEGQVATLASGLLSAHESADLLENIFESTLYRSDHDTFLLYPEKVIPSIIQKGIISPNECRGNPLISTALEAADTRLVERDERGEVRFSSRFRNRRDLEALLNTLSDEPTYQEIAATHSEETIDLYESIFDHHAFTGRSGGMYGYEGIGCTYWHMVAKLLVAAGECFIHADAQGENEDVLKRLAKAYHRIRDGLGFRRTAQQFGGIPIDAYSHTPAQRGAQQPGMTGQVKEELITRRMELGVSFDEGKIRFNPRLLADEEWLRSPTTWSLPGERANTTDFALQANSLGFQCWGLPVFYHRVDGPARIHLVSAEGTHTIEGHTIDGATSNIVRSHHSPFNRIDVEVPQERVSLA